MKKFLVLCFLVLAVMLASCGQYDSAPTASFRDYYANTWVIGEHALRYMERNQSLEGQLRGGIFFVSGTLTTEPALTFAWEPQPGNVVITTLPLARFYFVIDEEKTTPTVEFAFTNGELGNVLNGRGEPDPRYVITRELVVERNPNDFLNKSFAGGLYKVIVRISTKTLENEIYLPR